MEGSPPFPSWGPWDSIVAFPARQGQGRGGVELVESHTNKHVRRHTQAHVQSTHTHQIGSINIGQLRLSKTTQQASTSAHTHVHNEVTHTHSPEKTLHTHTPHKLDTQAPTWDFVSPTTKKPNTGHFTSHTSTRARESSKDTHTRHARTRPTVHTHN